MGERTVVSVVIPVYNTQENFLRFCVQSVWKQTYDALEVILVDDGSCQETARLCDMIAAEDDRTKVIHQKNGGVSSARNAGIEAACGAFLCFLDADDVLHPQYVELLLEAALEYDVPLAACDPWIGDANEPEFVAVEASKAAYYPGAEAWKHVNGGYCWNKLYRADLLKDIRYQPGLALLEDFLFVNLCLMQIDSCAKVGEKLYYYRKNDGSATRRMKPEKYVEALSVCDRVYNMYKQNHSQEHCDWIMGFRAEWHLRYLVALASQGAQGWQKLAAEERKIFLEKVSPYKADVQSKLIEVSLVMAKLPSVLFCVYLQLLNDLRHLKK